ncbi:uncharacterized protein BDZ99DRAFT_475719 [Mytilinidion resinicola]|uniref:CCHC-type domain-containing protein n=1 Tax=Mytilinidion resinicola TaxID=574789 RepID=A0A6A6YQN4_9PEZI|nr:uncharacterized protein BDZ99DRAFT_475719 [Mytilinidion resinicola]KAF2810843.1 hypothetical protein BDZ99DRAFT_475719 [Mytilinidion resinicola]
MPELSLTSQAGLPNPDKIQSWAQAVPTIDTSIVAPWDTARANDEARWLSSQAPSHCKFPSLARRLLDISHTKVLQHALLEGEDLMINAIDLEWHGREPRELTEVGLAVLDTRDIRGVEPGQNGENWLKQILGQLSRRLTPRRWRRMSCIGPKRKQVTGLAKLCGELDINPKELHNCGNDIAYTMMCAILMAGHGGKGAETFDEKTTSMAQLTENVQAATLASSKENDLQGVLKFCTRCSQDGHLVVDCEEQVQCAHCFAAGDWYKAYSHQTDRCKSEFFRKRGAMKL